MPFLTTRIALERLVQRRARRAAAIMRAKAVAERKPQVGPTDSAVPLALRKYNVVAVRRMLAAGKRRGYVTIGEAMTVMPKSGASEEDMVAVVNAIYELDLELE